MPGFYVAAGAVLALVGFGAWLWRPLVLGYAIHRVETTAEYPPMNPGWAVRAADKWLLYCMNAARGGNRRAMEVVVKRAGVKTPPSYQGSVVAPLYGPDVSYLAAVDQPGLFFETLERCDDGQVLTVLKALLDRPQADGQARFTARQAAREFEGLVAVQDPAVRKMARSALEFVRRRYAKELAGETER